MVKPSKNSKSQNFQKMESTEQKSENGNYQTQRLRKHNWNWNPKFLGQLIQKMEITKK